MCADERLLGRILGLVLVAEIDAADTEHHAAVVVEEAPEQGSRGLGLDARLSGGTCRH